MRVVKDLLLHTVAPNQLGYRNLQRLPAGESVTHGGGDFMKQKTLCYKLHAPSGGLEPATCLSNTIFPQFFLEIFTRHLTMQCLNVFLAWIFTQIKFVLSHLMKNIKNKILHQKTFANQIFVLGFQLKTRPRQSVPNYFLGSYIPKFLRSFIPKFLHSYIPTLLHSYIPTFLHFYIPTFLHSYIPRFLHSYIHAFIHSYIHKLIDSYIPTFLYSYIVILRQIYSFV